MIDHAVVIVGAGPTGLTLANLLGAAGVDTLLVEANDATVTEPRAVSIDDETLRTVQAMGLIDVVAGGIVSGYGSEYVSPGGRVFLKVKPMARPYGHPRRNAFRQPVFEVQLRNGLERFGCVSTMFRCRLERFEQDADGVTVRLAPRGAPPKVVRAAFLVGCDGARSGVREALGATLVGGTADERWLIVDLARSPAPSTETIVFCNARRPCIALPGPDLTRRYEFKVMPGEEETALLSSASVARLLETHGAALGSEIVRKTVYHFHARIADRWGDARVWLAGDAAHLSPPFAGQGMNSGIRDARNLAWKLVAVVHGRLGMGLLASYPAERRGHVLEMIRLARRMGAIMGPRSMAHGFLQRALFRFLSVWPAGRSWFAEMKYKPSPRFGRGFVVASMLRRRGVVGRLLPQPTIATGPHVGKPLDALLGEGFALLGIGVGADVSLGRRWDAMIDRRIALPAASVPELAAHAGRLLLLRPDHYVLARFTPDEVPRVLPELDALERGTWK